MSVNSPPLGATQSGSIRSASDRRSKPGRRAPLSRIGLLGLAGMLATGLLLVDLAPRAPSKLLPQTVQLVGGIGLAGSFGTTGINLGSAGLTVIVGLMLVSYVLTVGAARRLSRVLVLGCIAALNALIAARRRRWLSTDVFSYQFYGRIGQLYGFNPYLAGPHAIAGDPLYPVHRVEVDRHADRLRPGVHRAQLRAGAAVDPRQRVRVQGDRGASRASRSSRWCGTARACAASTRSRRRRSSG